MLEAQYSTGTSTRCNQLMSMKVLEKKRGFVHLNDFNFNRTKVVKLLIAVLLVGRVNGWMSMNTSASGNNKKVVVVGGGIQGTSVAYQIKKEDPSMQVTILESNKPASAASGKGGGFMARSWGDGGVTQSLHQVAFDMYEQLAQELSLESYRKLPVLSVRPGKRRGVTTQNRNIPSWLNGAFGGISSLGDGDDTAQVTPSEFVHAMLKDEPSIQVVKGTCTGVLTTDDNEESIISGVTYDSGETLDADIVVVSAGPWSCAAEDWFDNLQLPMEGVKSTSIVWEKPSSTETVDGTALFCGEDSRFGTHCK